MFCRANINLNHLESFFSLVDTGSFSQSSKNLKITQSAVSKRIKLLEEELQTQLFIRSNQEVTLSQQGKNFCEIIRPLYQEMCNQIQNFTLGENELRGKIVFACFQEVGEKVFIHALNEFKKNNPHIKFEVLFLKTSEIIQGVKEGTIDLGVISEAILQENIRSYCILEEEIVLATSSRNAIKKVTNFADLPFVTFREDHRLLGKYLKKIYPKIPMSKLAIEFSVSSHLAMIEVIKKHGYYAVLPLTSIQKEIDKGALITVGQKSMNTKLHLIHRDLDFPIPRVEALRKYLTNYLKQPEI